MNLPDAEREPDGSKRAHDEWLWAYTLVEGILQRHPGWETVKTCGVFGSNVVPLEAAVLAKNLNVELDAMRSELDKFKELNEDKFKTVNAYCHMASLDKWKIQKLVESIDQYLSAHGYDEQTKLLENGRADAVNSKVGLFDQCEASKK